MLLGVQLIDVAAETLGDNMDEKLAVVEVELLELTLVGVRGRKLKDPPLFDNVVEERRSYWAGHWAG